MTSNEERNAFILRRTLSAVSWLYSAWAAMFAALGFLRTTVGAWDPQFLMVHALLLGLAGMTLWKPRPGASVAVLAAAAGSIFFVVLDLRRHNAPAALLDGAYVVVSAVLLYKSRRQA